MNNKISLRKVITITGIIFLLLVIISASLTMYNNQKSAYGDGISITNMGQETSGREKPSSKNQIDYIQYELLKVVNMNSEKVKEGKDIEDAVIRENTFFQEHSESNNIYTVSFIVDIKSISQSYRASYQWEKGSDSTVDIDEWGTNIRCLSSDELIYGDFKCKDMFTVMGGDENTIIKHLPHSSLNYRITLDPIQYDTLNILIITSAADERIDADAAISGYKEDALEWIRSVGFNPQDFSINYTYNRASLY